MDRGLACWVAGLLVVAAVAAPAAGAGAPDGPFGVAQEEFDPDSVTLSAALAEDGSAAWSFKYRMELATDNETEAFENLRADIEENQSAYADRFRERIESTVASAENATGREMRVENVSVRAYEQSGGEFSDSYGFVEYTFEWAGFAAVEDDRIAAGDALEGFYLNGETSLRFSWEDGYAATDVDPAADDSASTYVQWSGEREFAGDEPRLVLEPTDPTTSDAGGTTTAASSGESSVVLPALVGALAAAVVVGAAGWLYVRRDGDEGAGGSGPATDSGSDDDAGGGTAAAGAAGAAGAAEESGDEPETEPPEELLSNEERVKKFLREQGGRAKQQDVVDAMGWTEAKTSQVVKDMRESDELESFRIGRENVLKLPDADIAEE